MYYFVGIKRNGEKFGPIGSHTHQAPRELAGSPIVFRYADNEGDYPAYVGCFRSLNVAPLGEPYEWVASFEIHRSTEPRSEARFTEADYALLRLLQQER